MPQPTFCVQGHITGCFRLAGCPQLRSSGVVKLFSAYGRPSQANGLPDLPTYLCCKPSVVGSPSASSLCASNSDPLSLGYSVAWLPSHSSAPLLAVGAPRYQHVGQVLLFQAPQAGGHWSQTQKLEGTQVRVTGRASARAACPANTVQCGGDCHLEQPLR